MPKVMCLTMTAVKLSCVCQSFVYIGFYLGLANLVDNMLIVQVIKMLKEDHKINVFDQINQCSTKYL